MSDLLVIVALISGFSIWYFAKKSPNKKRRNTSIVVLIASFLLFGVTSPNDDEPPKKPEKKVETITKTTNKKTPLLLEASPESQAGADDKAPISGKTTPKAHVTLATDTVEVDADGKFTFFYNMKSDTDVVLTLRSTFKNQTKEVKITIKPSAERLAKKAEAEQKAKEAQEAEAQRQAQERAAAEAQRKAAAEAQQQAQQQQNQNTDTNGLCVDGAPASGSPHARGKANSCYGHGGWRINH